MSGYYGPPIHRLIRDGQYGMVVARAAKAIAFVSVMMLIGQAFKISAVTLLGAIVGEPTAAGLALVALLAMVVVVDHRIMRVAVPETVNG